ncbi:MAG TPA: response regulator [Planctomycetota bacterium]
MVLLVEDDEDDIGFFRRALSKTNSRARLAVARDGDEAVAYLAGQGAFADRERHPAPTHVILDLKLPRRSGVEVLEWLRGEPALSRLPVAILSSSNEPLDVARARALGVDGYHVKPSGAAALAETVRRVLDAWTLS